MASMNEMPSLDDLVLFLAVAEHGSLSAAARDRDIPLPTFSRRMTGLERQLGESLFLRGPAGYALSARGLALAQSIEQLRDLPEKIAGWSHADGGPPVVKITAGTWMARHLALAMLGEQETAFRPKFVPSNARLDLARREADIGLRNQRSEHRWLAQRKMMEVRFAFYGMSSDVPVVVVAADTPSQRWIRERHHENDLLEVADSRLALDLAEAGIGKIVIPNFVGARSGLTQLDGFIDELTHDAWLIAHQDARHDPPIRAAIDRIVTLLIAS